MAQLGLWLASCLVLAWLTRSHPIRGVCVALGLWAFVPAVGGNILTGIAGGAIGFHPATWLIAAIVVVQLVTSTAQLSAALARHIYVAIAVVVFIGGAIVTSSFNSSGGTRLLVDQVVAPILVFWLVVAFAGGDRRALYLLRNTILVVIAVECVLAFIQLMVGQIIFYASDYETLYWFNPEKFDRWMGTTDSPLVLSLAISVAAPLTVSITRHWTRFGLLVVFLAGIIITQSRTGAVTMAALLLYIVIRAQMSVLVRSLYCVLFGVAGYLILTSALATGLNARIINDTGSAGARASALQFFSDSWFDFLVIGRGLTSSYRVAREAGLITSLESSYLMYAVDTGIVLTTIYFGAQFCLALRHSGQHGIPGATAAALIGLTLQHTFSAVAGTNLSGTLIWTVLAMTVVGSTLKPGRGPTVSNVPEPEPMPRPTVASVARARGRG